MRSAKDVAKANIDAFNAHDEERFGETIAADAAFEAPGDIRLTGRDATVGYAMSWLRAFPDARLVVNNELEAGDWIVQEFTFEGTHEATLSGPAGDVPATHRRLTGRGVQIFRVDGGEIADGRLYFDQVQVLTQLGLMPEPAAATA
jgi:steroid delta-isomerase-like uncharacterized protein